MVKLVKCAPSQLTLTIDPRQIPGERPEIGDEIFVWTEETDHGVGLTLRGEVRHVANSSIIVTIIGFPGERFGLADVRPFGEQGEHEDPNSSEYSIASVVQVNSWKKFVSLDQDDASFLRRKFRKKNS